MQNNFFGSKLNTVLLLVLIVLMVFAIKIMLKNKELYPPFDQREEEVDSPPQISGNKGDLVSFSISPGQKVSGLVPVSGSVKNAYFFEANILLNILDADKNLLRAGHGQAISDWMTAEPVSFEGKLDFTGLPAGPAYVEIHNDNASALPEHDKSILIPVVIE